MSPYGSNGQLLTHQAGDPVAALMQSEALLPTIAFLSDDRQFMHAIPGQIRYLSMNDLHRDARDAWLLSAFPTPEQHTFVDLETRFLSIAEQDYETLIIGGNAPVRAAH